MKLFSSKIIITVRNLSIFTFTISSCFLGSELLAQSYTPSPTPITTPQTTPTTQNSNISDPVSISFNREELNRSLAGTTYANHSYREKQDATLRALGYSATRRINRHSVIAYSNPDLPTSLSIPELTISPIVLGSFASSKEVTPNDPLFGNQWYLKNISQILPDEDLTPQAGLTGYDIGASSAWTKQQGSREVIVAVIDSGIDYKHKDLENNIWNNIKDPIGDFNSDGNNDDDRNSNDLLHYTDDFKGWDFSRCDEWGDSSFVRCKRAKTPSNDPIDKHLDGHGTHVTGIIAAQANNAFGIAGVSWNTSILPLKVGSREGLIPESELLEAIQYVINLRKNHNVNIRVINISASWRSQCSTTLRRLLNEAGALGILVIAAAGNNYPSGLNIDDNNPISPAICATDNLITVAASNHLGQLARSSNYSNRYVHISAPGKYITSTLPNNKLGSYSGTSQATAIVSGAAALLFAAKPELSSYNAKDLILKSGRRLDCARHSSLCNNTSSGATIDLTSLLSTTQSIYRGWQNPSNKLDVNNDGHISPTDALLIINELSNLNFPGGKLPLEKPQTFGFLDINNDGYVSPMDALLVINKLNELNRISLENAERELVLEKRSISAGTFSASLMMLVGDTNQDLRVDSADITLILQNYGPISEDNKIQEACDLDKNKIVNDKDLNILYSNFGASLQIE